MPICVMCKQEKEADYCFDCEQIRRRTIKQFKNHKKDKQLKPEAYNH